jgi:hypothetical protein
MTWKSQMICVESAGRKVTVRRPRIDTQPAETVAASVALAFLATLAILATVYVLTRP